MPGFSLVYNFKGRSQERESKILGSLDSIIHDENFKKTILLRTESCFLAFTGYKEYPLISFDNDRYLIHVEGKIYGKEHAVIECELNNLADWLFESPIQRQENITQWLLNADGDFIVFVLKKKSGDILILNDALGRLPLYYFQAEDEFIASREVRFIAGLSKIKRLDRVAIAQYLLLSYPLGVKTLLEQVDRSQPASVVRINAIQSKIQTHHSNCFNFEIKDHQTKSIEQNAAELVSIFSLACTNRTTSGSKNILGLSGGLDSRCIAACLRQEKIPFAAATRLDFGRATNLDATIAEQLAGLLNIDWRLFRIGPPTGKDLARLLRIKYGLNYLAAGFILPFFAMIKDAFGCEMTYWTGDGGDKVKTDLRPSRSLPSIDGLVDYIVTRHQVFSLPTVVALTGVGRREILDSIMSLISSYPEKDPAQKYIRFLVHEKALKWNFEGEDRNRFYFWSVAPFYSIHFFKYAMGCPDEQKAGHGLYRAFLARLSPDAAALDNANWGFSLDSKKYLLMALLKKLILNKLSPEFRKKLKHSTRRNRPSRYRDALKQQLSHCPAVGNYLSLGTLESSLASWSPIEIQTLLTITSLIEETECGGNTLENFAECEFV